MAHLEIYDIRPSLDEFLQNRIFAALESGEYFPTGDEGIVGYFVTVAEFREGLNTDEVS